MPVLEPIIGRRINAMPVALDQATWPAGSQVVRIAPDDVFLIGEGEIELADPHAIVDHEAGFSGLWLARDKVEGWLHNNAIWTLGADGEVAQGMAAHLPIKAVPDGERVLILIASVVAHELEERLP